MNVLALAAALVLAQTPDAPRVEEPAGAAGAPVTPAPAPQPDPIPAGTRAVRRRPAATSTATSSTSTSTSSAPTSTSTSTSTSTTTSATPAPRPPRPLPDADDALATARAFAAALAASDADALARLASDRFSFDGEVQTGREAIRRTWRALLAGRPGPAPAVRDVQVQPAADAVTRYGKPPARVAPLARPGALVAVCDVGGRTVVLFLAREAGRMAVLGMSD